MQSHIIYFFAANNYERLRGALEGSIESLGEQARNYVEDLKADVEQENRAVDSGNKEAMEEALDKGAKDTKAGASHTKSNPKLFKLASETAPAQMEKTEEEIKDGKADGATVTQLMGAFADQINEDTEQASDM